MKKHFLSLTVSILTAACVLASCGSSSAGNGAAGGTENAGAAAEADNGAAANADSGAAANADNGSAAGANTAAADMNLGDLELSVPTTEKLLYGSYNSVPLKMLTDYGKEQGEIISDPQFKTRLMYAGKDIEKECTASKVPVSVTAWAPYGNATEKSIQEVYSYMYQEVPDHAEEYFQNYLELVGSSWISMSFADENLKTINDEFTYVYTVDGNTLRCRRIVSVDENTAEMIYSDEPEEIFHFGFDGRDLILEQDGSTVQLSSQLTAMCETMYTEEFPEDWHYNLSGWIDKDEHAFSDIANLYISWNAEDHENADLTNIWFTDGSQGKGDEAVLLDDHTVKLTWEGKESWLGAGEDSDEAGSVTVRFLDCGGNGLLASESGCILIDDAGNYYLYQTDESVYKENKFGSTAAENTDFENLSEDETAELAAKQDFVVTQLKEGFEASGVVAQVDETTGTVRFDTNILFAVDSADVSEEGKAGLDEFLSVYVPIMKTQADEGLVAQIMIDGHTDTSGSHDYNQDLSERRAAAVADYVTAAYPDIAPYIEAHGYSFDRPVFAEDGTVDMDASRRVEFRFILK